MALFRVVDAAEQARRLDQSMLAAEEHRCEDRMPEAGQLGAQIVRDQRRRSEQRSAWVLLSEPPSESGPPMPASGAHARHAPTVRNRETENVAT